MVAFVVNRHGSVHSVAEERLAELLRSGYRMPSTVEIAQWYAMQGLEMPNGSNDVGSADNQIAVAHKRSRRRKPGVGG